MRLLLAALHISLLGLCLWTGTVEAASGKSETLWCAINSPEAKTPDDMARIPLGRLYIVSPSMQLDAKRQLRADSFVSLSPSEAQRYLKDGESLSGAPYRYLVRVGEFGLSPYRDLPAGVGDRAPLEAYFSKSSAFLRVVNFSSSPRGAKPAPFPMVIETDNPVLGFQSDCVTAK